MSEIASKERIEAKALLAFANSKPSNKPVCPYPHGTIHADIWNDHIDYLENMVILYVALSNKRKQASPQSHIAPVHGLRVDAAHP